jgi:hypothetical protein
MFSSLQPHNCSAIGNRACHIYQAGSGGSVLYGFFVPKKKWRLSLEVLAKSGYKNMMYRYLIVLIYFWLRSEKQIYNFDEFNLFFHFLLLKTSKSTSFSSSNF